ncbi:hypothetical protein B0H65DRAFT_72301 [Neurospora tetraspora]|uniref:Secreted protein n=1 Tax=Neurospora tetraspora TaxID=94610 RepID=A0AAE0JRP6_9PEZI|nr:hypothetical protein B0H65DRAFT_72301 [Neurospora tetraspora]
MSTLSLLTLHVLTCSLSSGKTTGFPLFDSYCLVYSFIPRGTLPPLAPLEVPSSPLYIHHLHSSYPGEESRTVSIRFQSRAERDERVNSEPNRNSSPTTTLDHPRQNPRPN